MSLSEIHQAGAMVNRIQRCVRCGVILRASVSDLTPYPYGSRVEVTPTFQVMRLDQVQPTCTPATLPVPSEPAQG